MLSWVTCPGQRKPRQSRSSKVRTHLPPLRVNRHLCVCAFEHERLHLLWPEQHLSVTVGEASYHTAFLIDHAHPYKIAEKAFRISLWLLSLRNS